jgi:hypothetical protein
MSDWSVVSDDFVPRKSKSSKAWVWEDDGTPIINDIYMGSELTTGPIINDTVCLIKE